MLGGILRAAQNLKESEKQRKTRCRGKKKNELKRIRKKGSEPKRKKNTSRKGDFQGKKK